MTKITNKNNSLVYYTGADKKKKNPKQFPRPVTQNTYKQQKHRLLL